MKEKLEKLQGASAVHSRELVLQPAQGEQLPSFSCGCFAFSHLWHYGNTAAIMFLLQTHSLQMWYCLEKSRASQKVVVLAFSRLSGMG